jgi:hypothetical protein
MSAVMNHTSQYMNGCLQLVRSLPRDLDFTVVPVGMRTPRCLRLLIRHLAVESLEQGLNLHLLTHEALSKRKSPTFTSNSCTMLYNRVSELLSQLLQRYNFNANLGTFLLRREPNNQPRSCH